MKRLLFLVIALAALVGVSVWQKQAKDAKLSENGRRGAETRENLFPGVDVNQAKVLRILSEDGEVNLKVQNDTWAVMERDGYPASLDRLRRSVAEIVDTKIAGKQMIREGAWDDVDVIKPGGDTKDGVGTLVEMTTESGETVASMVIGKEVDVSGGRNPSQFGGSGQRFVRIPEDGDSIWMVGTTFYDLEAKPEMWIDKAFIDVKDIGSVAVTHPAAEESWKASRGKFDQTDFALLDAKEGEVLDTAKVPLATLLSAPTFNDVRSAKAAGDLMKDAVKATIATFDGFEYDLSLAKTSEAGADKHFLTVTVKADLPEKRVPGKDEKEEDKSKLDEEFEAKKKELAEKLAKEKTFEGWVFEVAEYTVSSLLKKRSEILKEPEAPAVKVDEGGSAPAVVPAPSSPPAAMVPTSPGAGPISVTTPPVAVPPLPKPEVKPEPAADANPAEVE